MIKKLTFILLFLIVPVTGYERVAASKQQNIQGKIRTIISSKAEESTEINPELCNHDENNVLSFYLTNSNKIISVCTGDKPQSYIVLRVGDGKSFIEYPKNRENSWNYFKYSYYSRGGGSSNDTLDLNYLTYEDDQWKIKISEEYSDDEDGEKTTLLLTTTNKATGKETQQAGDVESVKGSLVNIRDNENIKTIPYED